MEQSEIRGIIFDYGGTIDSRGEHWSHIIRRGYCKAGIKVGDESFREAYVHAERLLATSPLIKPHHNFLDLMSIKIRAELEFLADMGLADEKDLRRAGSVAEYCHDYARKCTSEASAVLTALHRRMPLALVSNFYGNIETVLKDFGLRDFFISIVESSVVGIRKPDPRIFSLGAEALGLPANRILVVGDSLDKDIIPAESIGCRTAWLKGRGWTNTDHGLSRPFINSLDELLVPSFNQLTQHS